MNLKKLSMKKKGELGVGNLLGIGMGLVVLVIGVAYGLQVTGDVRDDMTENTSEYNATVSGITAISIIPTKLGTIVTILMAAVVIGILVRHLAMRFMG